MDAMIERATNGIAAGAIASPWWLPSLGQLSDFAGLMLPVLGCVWLLLQIILKITDRK